SRASLMAGANDVASGRLPYFFAMWASAAGSPGIPAASGPFSDAPGMMLPAASWYMVRVAAPGAISRPSTMTFLPVFALCNSQKPPPPRPELNGSTTPSAAETATAASKALPPVARISMPAAVAAGWALEMAALGGVGAASAVLAITVSRTAANQRDKPRQYMSAVRGALAQTFGNDGRHQAVDMTVQERDFTHQCR